MNAPLTNSATASVPKGKVNGGLCIRGCGKPMMQHSNFCSQECLNAASAELKAQETQQAQQNPATNSAVRLTQTEKNEQEAKKYCKMLLDYIAKKQGRFLIDEQGEYSVLLDGQRIPLNLEADNYAFNRLLIAVCNITAAVKVAPSVLIRFIDVAHAKVGKFKLRRFSAMSRYGERLYVPLQSQKQLLRITAEGIKDVPNGDNEDDLWVEMPPQVLLDPKGDGEGLNYRKDSVKDGLAEFERLVVNTQACRVPEMAWFVAMQEGLYPFVRDLYEPRFIVHHEGQKGSGKTSGAEFIGTMHGLRFFGNATPAAIRRLGDCGLLLLDNKEDANMTQSFNDDMIFNATGGTGLRCYQDGVRSSNVHPPIQVITSIEGPSKPEIVDRTVPVEYNADEREQFKATPVLIEIRKKRHLMLSALMSVLQRFLKINREERTIHAPKALKRFNENFDAVVRLLMAYADVARKPSGWVDSNIEAWKKTIDHQKSETDGDEFAFQIEQFLDDLDFAIERIDTGSNPHNVSLYLRECADTSMTVTFEGQKGSLVVTTVSRLMAHLLEKHRFSRAIPKSPAQFGKRLKKLVTRRFRILDEDSGLPQLKRKNQQRVIGIFEPVDLAKKKNQPDPIDFVHAKAQQATANANVPTTPKPVVAVQSHPKSVTPVQPIRDVYNPQTAVAKAAV